MLPGIPVALAFLLVAGCSDSPRPGLDSGSVDAGSRDLSLDAVAKDLPPVDALRAEGNQWDAGDLELSVPDVALDSGWDQGTSDLSDLSELSLTPLDLASMDSGLDVFAMDAPQDLAATADQSQQDQAADLVPNDLAQQPDQSMVDAAPDLLVVEAGPMPDTGPSATCLAQCLAKAPYLCTTSSGSCVECEKDLHCTGNPWSLGNKCNTSYKICTCTKDSECTGRSSGKKCHAAPQICGCASSSDCLAGLKCDATFYGYKVCSKGCSKDAECTNSSTPRCDKGSGKCVACVGNADCAAGAPYCAVSSNTCVACTQSSHCVGSPNGGTCDTASGACGCKADADCSGPSAFGGKCTTYSVPGATLKVCRCAVSAHCKGKASGPTCTTPQAKCSCAKDAECTFVSQPKCAPPHAGAAYKQCQKACVTDKDCTADASLPRCVKGTCQACKGDADCASASAPYCLSVGTKNSCVACKTSGHCSGGTPVCASASGTCVACTADKECAGSPDGARCVSGACTCKASSDCGKHAWGGKCDSVAGRCACAASSDCSQNLNGPACSATQKLCGCSTGSQCGVARPVCGPADTWTSHTHCKPGCKSDADCAASAANRKCDLTSGACVGCLKPADCSLYGYPWYQTCSAKQLCLECEKDAHCTSASLGSTCDLKTNYCVCKKDADCTGNANGARCDTIYKACSCTQDSHCPAGKKCGASTPFGSKYCT